MSLLLKKKSSIVMKSPSRLFSGGSCYSIFSFICMFSFGHCVICPSIYGMSLPIWYLQSLLSKYNWINVQDKYIYPMQFFGSFVQSILHPNLSHVSHPNGGVNASPLSNRSTTGIKVITNNTTNIFCDSSEIKIQPER